MDQIRIRFTRYSAFYAPLLLAMGAGHLRDEGIEAAYDTVTPERTLEAGIASGEVQVGQSAPAAAFRPQEAGETLPYRHFALMNARDGFFVAARAGSGIRSWEDLAGRSLVADHYFQPLGFLRRALDLRGVDEGQVTFLDEGAPAAMEAAFRAGRGDAVHLQGPAAQELEAEGLATIIGSVGELVGPVAFSTLVAAPEWSGGPIAPRFRRAFGRARAQAAAADPAWIAGAIAGFLPGATHEALAATVTAYQRIGTWSGDPVITADLFERTADVIRSSGHITRAPSPDGILAPAPER